MGASTTLPSQFQLLKTDQKHWMFSFFVSMSHSFQKAPVPGFYAVVFVTATMGLVILTLRHVFNQLSQGNWLQTNPAAPLCPPPPNVFAMAPQSISGFVLYRLTFHLPFAILANGTMRSCFSVS